jgi:predicted nucleic acid-binding protein
VFVYARDVREARKQPRAARWLEHLWQRQLGRTSVQVLAEYYATVTRKLDPGLPPTVAWDDVSQLMAWRPLPSDETLLKRGRDIELRYRLNWWDSLIVAAAQLQGCALLLSEDMQDGADYGGVTVRNPFMLEVSEPAATYGMSAAPGRHPPRGRPKGTAKAGQRALTP